MCRGLADWADEKASGRWPGRRVARHAGVPSRAYFVAALAGAVGITVALPAVLGEPLARCGDVADDYVPAP
jgi:hypothetical protein